MIYQVSLSLSHSLELSSWEKPSCSSRAPSELIVSFPWLIVGTEKRATRWQCSLVIRDSFIKTELWWLRIPMMWLKAFQRNLLETQFDSKSPNVWLMWAAVLLKQLCSIQGAKRSPSSFYTHLSMQRKKARYSVERKEQRWGHMPGYLPGPVVYQRLILIQPCGSHVQVTKYLQHVVGELLVRSSLHHSAQESEAVSRIQKLTTLKEAKEKKRV